MTTCEQVSDALPAVALDAASAREELDVRGHVATCDRCAALLDELCESAHLLALAVPQVAPPPDLRLRVLAAVAAEPPSPPRHPMTWRHRLPRISAAWGTIAAALIVSAGSLFWVARLQADVTALSAQEQTLRDKAARYDRIVGVLDSRRLMVRTLEPASADLSASGTIYIDPSSGVGMATLHDLPPLPSDRAYQVWFGRTDGGRMSAGMVHPDNEGRGYAVLRVPTDLENYRVIGLTDEPASGSPWPTTPRVIGTSL